MTELTIELAFASKDRQFLVELRVPRGAEVSEVIALSGVAEAFPDLDVDALNTGIWGRIVERNEPVRDGDRVELYRPLLLNPRDARRLRAASKRGT